MIARLYRKRPVAKHWPLAGNCKSALNSHSATYAANRSGTAPDVNAHVYDTHVYQQNEGNRWNADLRKTGKQYEAKMVQGWSPEIA